MNNMAYENNNVRAGANGAGVYVGNTEIMGGGVNNILDTNYTLPCKVVIINASNKTLNAYFKFANDNDIPFSLEPNGVLYKSFDSNKEVYLNLSDDINQTMNGILSYGYDDGTPTVDSYEFSKKTEIQFSGDSEIKAAYICIITEILG